MVKHEEHQYEISTWLRTLDFLQQENIHLKTRLAELIKHNTVGPEVLEKAEYFQNNFLNKDTVIALLRRDIKLFQLDEKQAETNRKHKTLRLDMEKMEKEFINLRTDFNNYLRKVS